MPKVKRFFILVFILLVFQGLAEGYWVKVYERTTGPILVDINFVNSLEGYAVGSSGTILKTTNGGVDWAIIPSDTAVELKDVSVIGNKIQVVGWDGMVRTTTTNGDSWSVVQPSSDPSPAGLFELYFADENNGFVAGDWDGTNSIWRTENGGISWSGASVLFGYWLGMHATAVDNVWVDGTAGLYAKWDGGSWSTGNPPGYFSDFHGIHVENSSYVALAGDYSPFAAANFFRTINGGADWTGVNVGAETLNLNDVWFVDTNKGWVVGGGGKIYSTTNGGGSASDWTEETSNTTTDLWSLCFVDASHGWATGGSPTQGSIILRYVTADFPDIHPGDPGIIIVHPDRNPWNPNRDPTLNIQIRLRPGTTPPERLDVLIFSGPGGNIIYKKNFPVSFSEGKVDLTLSKSDFTFLQTGIHLLVALEGNNKFATGKLVIMPQ